MGRAEAVTRRPSDCGIGACWIRAPRGGQVSSGNGLAGLGRPHQAGINGVSVGAAGQVQAVYMRRSGAAMGANATGSVLAASRRPFEAAIDDLRVADDRHGDVNQSGPLNGQPRGRGERRTRCELPRRNAGDLVGPLHVRRCIDIDHRRYGVGGTIARRRIGPNYGYPASRYLHAGSGNAVRCSVVGVLCQHAHTAHGKGQARHCRARSAQRAGTRWRDVPRRRPCPPLGRSRRRPRPSCAPRRNRSLQGMSCARPSARCGTMLRPGRGRQAARLAGPPRRSPPMRDQRCEGRLGGDPRPGGSLRAP